MFWQCWSQTKSSHTRWENRESSFRRVQRRQLMGVWAQQESTGDLKLKPVPMVLYYDLYSDKQIVPTQRPCTVSHLPIHTHPAKELSNPWATASSHPISSVCPRLLLNPAINSKSKQSLHGGVWLCQKFCSAGFKKTVHLTSAGLQVWQDLFTYLNWLLTSTCAAGEWAAPRSHPVVALLLYKDSSSFT